MQEEVGLIGASNVEEHFLWDVDAAFVLDRRGTNDIVVSCGGYVAFCDEVFGQLIESIAVKTTSVAWRCIDGGSSDTRIWAEHGVQSVNLSVGYLHEHTEDERLDVAACYETTVLLEGIFEQVQKIRRVIRGNRVRAVV